MAKKVKQYLVTFAKGEPQEVTYPIEATSKQAAAEEFSRQYIGYYSQALASIVEVVLVKDEGENE